MERSELISKLCKEAAETTPDLYNKILKAAKAEGLIGTGGAGAGSAVGSGVGRAAGTGAGGSAVKSVTGAAVKNRVVAAVAGIIAAIVATMAVAVPLALNIKSGIGGGSEMEAPGENGGNSGIGGGQLPTEPANPSNPSTPETPVDPKPENPEPSVPVDPDGVKSIAIKHGYGEGKYLWNEKDVLAGEYKLYGAQLEITRNDGVVYNEPLTADLLGDDVDFSVGNHEITVAYGGKTAELSVFVAPDDGYIEAVTGKFELKGTLDTLIFDVNRPYELDFGGLEIEGEFNLKHNGATYFGYYGKTPVNERFIKNFDGSKPGMQKSELTAGNISSAPEAIGEFNAFGYNTAETEERIFLSNLIILNAANEVVYYSEISPEKPYIDINKIPDRYDYYEPDYRVDFIFRIGEFTVYTGNGDSIVSVGNIWDFNYYSYTLSGDTSLWSVLNIGERVIKLKSETESVEVAYTVYNSDYTNIRFCRVHGEDIISYTLTDGVTLDSIKKDLLKRSLYVEYFEKENGKYVDFVPVTADMLNFDNVDVNSYNLQYGGIVYRDKTVAVNITRPYTVAGANILYSLTSTRGANLILSEATVNDLGQCANDVCKEIVLYDNGVAMLKHTGNGIGNVLTGYILDGNKLTLLRHGNATSFLTVDLNGKTFEVTDLKSVTSGMTSTTYTFNHKYSPDGSSYIGWSGTFIAYTGQTGFDYAWYVKVHLTGWASTPDSNGQSYQIAGVEYVATWAFGWNNNKNAFVLRFADKDWWFEIGTPDDYGRCELTLIKTVNAS